MWMAATAVAVVVVFWFVFHHPAVGTTILVSFLHTEIFLPECRRFRFPPVFLLVVFVVVSSV